jgi:hypothetical protein
MPCRGLALHQAHFPINSLEFHRMPTPTYTTHSIPDESMPVGTDFIGGALPLTAGVGRGEFDKDRAA